MVGRPEEPLKRTLNARSEVLPSLRPWRHHFVRRGGTTRRCHRAQGNEFLPAAKDKAILADRPLAVCGFRVARNTPIRLARNEGQPDIPSYSSDTITSTATIVQR